MPPTDLAELRRLHEAATKGQNWQEEVLFAEACKLSLPALLYELEAARKENDFLRLRLAESDRDCVYCNLPASEMPKCSSGFPGCARADDLYGCDELSRRDDRMKLIGAAEWLVANNERLDTMNRSDVEEVAAQLRKEAEK